MKMRTIFGFALIAVLGMAFASQSAQDYFQQALSKERGEGNLKEAIALYQKAIESAKDEALAAKAQLQIGLCYEKLGLTEAEKAFRLVIDKYPSQAETVKQAKERLELMASASRAPASAAGMVLRKLDIPMGIISPDGKYIGSSDSDSELFLYEIASGSKQILKKDSEAGFLMSSVLWSPDSQKFAYVWAQNQEEALYVWTIGDKEPRLIPMNRPVDFFEPIGWPPGHKTILINCLENNVRFLAWLDLSRGSLEKITEPGLNISDVALSPDGKLIALKSKKDPNEPETRIMTADGRSSSRVLQILSSDRILTWTPGGKQILFSSNRTGQNALWLLEVSNGQAIGEPVLHSLLGGNVYTCGMTRSGQMYYSSSRQAHEAYTAKIDIKTGKTLQPPQKVELESVGRTSTPIWSADGKSLGYFFRKNAAAGQNSYDSFKMKDLHSGSIKEIPLDFSADVEMIQLPRWSKDGNFIYLLGRKAGGRGLFRIEIASGKSEIVADERRIAAWSSDGKFIILQDYGNTNKGNIKEWQLKLIRKEIETGTRKILYEGEVGEMMTWVMVSPDDSLVSFTSSVRRDRTLERGLRILPANPEIPLSKDQITTLNPSSGALVYGWAADGNGLIMGILPPQSSQESGEGPVKYQWVYYPDFNQSATPIKLELDLFRCSNMTFHPDGQTIAYTKLSSIDEFWVLENFLPKK